MDTDVLIDYLRKPSNEVKHVMESVYERKVSACTTSVNAFEIWSGAHLAPKKAELVRDTEDFFGQLEVVNFNYESSVEAGRVLADLRRRGEAIEIRDLFVGCICKMSGMPLITRNLKHYRRVRGLKVLTPEQALKKLKL
ncbi:MAG TPA: type II toxin-antitoxin system VapC family toxin [Candidatus Bathyarchaeia archaeon]|nr:type II toxin-antitoxin system VapC family toxin [Candidatus Bathyarchaeia archaeon]